MDKAGDILKSFLSFYRLGEGDRYVSFFSDWKAIVGEDIACHAQAVDIHNGALLVEVDHPGWMQILQMKQTEILRLIEKKHPDLGVRVLHMRLVKEGTVPQKRSVAPEPSPKTEASEEPLIPDRTEFEKSAIDRIENEDFKNQLKRLGASIKERNRKSPR